MLLLLALYGLRHNNAVQDPDGDYVRCRWAESSLNECGDVCRSFPASLDDRDVSCVVR